MKLTVGGVQSCCPERLVEAVRRVVGFAEEQHRRDSLLQKTPRNAAQQPAPEPLLLDAAQQINLIQLARKPRYAAIVWHSFREPHELAIVIFYAKAKPITPRICECSPPLVSAKLIGGASLTAAPMSLVESVDMQRRKCRYVILGRVTDAECHTESGKGSVPCE